MSGRDFMGLLDRIFKPKWQHDDPKVRLEAIKKLDDQEKLGEVAINDSDETIRLAAVEIGRAHV